MLAAAAALPGQAVGEKPVRSGLYLPRQLFSGASGEGPVRAEESRASLPAPSLRLIEAAADWAGMSPPEALG